MSPLAVLGTCVVGFVLGAGLRLLRFSLKAVRPGHRWLLALAGLALVPIPVLALLLAGDHLFRHPAAVGAGLCAGVGLGWLLGSAFRVLPWQRPHYFARHRGRRQYRHLRNPETDPGPSGPNPFTSGPLQPAPPEDRGNPFRDLKLTDDHPADRPAGDGSAE